MKKTLKCPKCKTSFLDPNDGEPPQCFLMEDGVEFEFEGCRCPACDQFIIWADVPHRQMIYPPIRESIDLSKYVPEALHRDFMEAQRVLESSPDASAMFSRRCLQRIIEQKFGITRKNLHQEIEAVAALNALPSTLAQDLHVIKEVGNFAVHPSKSLHPDQVVDTEPGEALWLLEILDALFDFAFVAPIKAAERRQALNEKLVGAGRKPLADARSIAFMPDDGQPLQ
jgi:uncharacterized protein DUF4145